MDMTGAALKRYLNKYTALHFFTGSIQCTYSVYILMFLREKGITDFESGLVVALNALAGVAGRALFSYISDRTGKAKQTVLALLLLQLLLCIPFAFPFDKSVLMMVSVAYHFAAYASPSLTEAWFFHNAYGFAEQYSRLYLSNVIAVIIFGTLNGFLVQSFGWGLLFWMTVIQIVMQIGIGLMIEDRPPPDTKEEAETKVSIGALLKYKSYVVVTLWLTLTSVFTMIQLSFLPVIVEAVGGGTAEYAVVRVVMYLLTVPLLLKGDKVVSKFNASALMLTACLLYGMGGLCAGFARNIVLICIGAVCQGTGGIIMHIALKNFISKAMPYKLAVMGQSIADAMYLGVSSVLAGLLAGSLTEIFQVSTAMIISGVAALLAGGVIFLIAFRFRKKNMVI